MPDSSATTASAPAADGFSLPLDSAARRRLHERDPVATARAIAITLAGLAAVFGLALGVGGALGVLAGFVLAIAVQTRMAVLMHEGAHGLIARERARNDALTDWLAAWPLGMTVERYRRNHLPHHTALGTPEDPDFVALCLPPIERGIGWSVRGCLLGLRHVELLLKYVRGDRRGDAESAQSAGSTLASIAGPALWQGALFGLCFSAGHAWVYFAVWLLPLLTVAVLINELRSIVEHTPLVPPLAAGESRTLEPIARTVRPGFVGRHWIGALHFHLHHEHHALPGVPFSRLPELHRLLEEQGYYRERPELLADGYPSIVTQLWRRYAPGLDELEVRSEGGVAIVRRG